MSCGYNEEPGSIPKPTGSITCVLASVPPITVFTKPALNCGSDKTHFIFSFLILAAISAILAALGSDASPREIAPEAGKS